MGERASLVLILLLGCPSSVPADDDDSADEGCSEVDETEPNDASPYQGLDAAPPICLAGSSETCGDGLDYGDVDYYVLTLAAGRYTFSLRWEGGADLDTYLWGTDPAEQPEEAIFAFQEGSEGLEDDAAEVPNGTYWLQVGCWEGESPVPYSMEVAPWEG